MMKEIDNALGHASVLKNKQISQGVQASASFHHCFITIMIVTQQGRTKKNKEEHERTKKNKDEQ